MSSGKATHSHHLKAQVFLFHKFVAYHSSHSATTVVQSGYMEAFWLVYSAKNPKKGKERGEE
jgi:hypothetical protein